MKNKLLIVLLILFCSKSFSQTFTYNDYRDYVVKKYDFKKYYNSKKNIFIKDNVVHIFIDENGNLIEIGIPTTAIEKYSYKLHLITNTESIKNTSFQFTFRGEYKPTLNIENEILSENEGVVQSENRNTDPKIIEFPYATIGPFTTDFNISLKKIESSSEEIILDKTINIAKTYHVSISTGLFMTTLKNPTNIKESTNNNNETILIADDQNARGLVVLTAVFYPKGRSFLFPPSGGIFSPERFGILIGTQIDKDQFENFFGGIQFDFARGGSIALGAHYGRRNIISGKKEFNFGSEMFDGDINIDIVKNWDIGFFIGVNIDLRVFGQLFKIIE